MKLRNFYSRLWFILVLILSASAMADRRATLDDGRAVILKDDGHWVFESADRFATSEEGTRVRLKANGQWQYIGNAPKADKEQVLTESLNVTLKNIVTETYKERSGKNTRFNSQTIFYLDVKVSSYSAEVDTKLSHFNLFSAFDSRGNKYPILDVSPQIKRLKPGQKVTLAVRVDGSPSGKLAIGIKHINLAINKAVFGTPTDLEFSKRTDEIKKLKRNVNFN